MFKLFSGFLFFVVALVSFSNPVFAKAKPKNYPPHIQRELDRQEELVANAEDRALIQAYNNQRRVNFVEGSGLVVLEVLPDDRNGREHQKFVVRLSNGKQLQAVYNSDMCPRLPIREGDVVSMGGEFIWSKSGGLLHWLHRDPNDRRPAGYVEVNGRYYCRD